MVRSNSGREEICAAPHMFNMQANKFLCDTADEMKSGSLVFFGKGIHTQLVQQRAITFDFRITGSQ
jgi:hypothetical protein